MKKYILLILITVVTLFIWINSLLPGSVSSSQSNFIVNMIYPLFEKVVSVELFTTIIRKLAHFTEYFILGVVLTLFYIKTIRVKKYYLIVIIHGLLTAIIDETIQTFTPNRAGLFTDVLIDLSGVIFGLIFIMIILKIKNNKKKIENNI